MEPMQRRHYRFSNEFNLAAPRDQVHAVLVDVEHYGEWWPQVRAVAKLGEDNALVVCRSTLPYDLELLLTAVSRETDVLEVAIDGPIRGWARYHLDEPSPGVTSLRCEQEVYAESLTMVLASYVARPLLVWNHGQMMRGLDSGIRARLAELNRAGQQKSAQRN